MTGYQIVSEAIDRSKLPFRKTTDLFIFDGKGNVIARDMRSYMSFPGGGVDEGETVEKSAMRESLEEVGAITDKPKIRKVLSFIWSPAWASTAKRKKRYEQFKGEEIYLLTANIKRITKPTSREGDAWNRKNLWMPVVEVIKLIKSKPGDPKMKKYRDAQLMILKKYGSQ
jgi:8-oxo-dGTP pyrophosphatase MutT (NUDIX family)